MFNLKASFLETLSLSSYKYLAWKQYDEQLFGLKYSETNKFLFLQFFDNFHVVFPNTLETVLIISNEYFSFKIKPGKFIREFEIDNFEMFLVSEKKICRFSLVPLLRIWNMKIRTQFYLKIKYKSVSLLNMLNGNQRIQKRMPIGNDGESNGFAN